MRRAAASLAQGARRSLLLCEQAGGGTAATTTATTMDSSIAAPISFAALMQQARAASNAAASSSSPPSSSSSTTSSATASVTVPSYEIETFHARLRRGTGSLDASKLRKAGRVPATVVGLPGGKTLTLSLPSSEIEAALRTHGGRRGVSARVFDVRVKASPGVAAEAAGLASAGELSFSDSSSSSSSSPSSSFTLRVLPRQIHRGMVSGVVENVNFLLLGSSSPSSSSPSGDGGGEADAAAAAAEKREKKSDKKPRSVSVRVPIVVLGAATAPGVKRGGFLNLIRRDVRLRCEMRGGGGGAAGGDPSPSSSPPPSFVVPRSIEVDASHLELGERVALRSLSLPEGVFLDEEHLDLPVLKVAGRQARD